MSGTDPPPQPISPNPQVEAGSTPRQLHPLPRGLVELYGLLAVLVVLVPEWMANGALLGFAAQRRGAALPPPAQAWRQVPELRLAGMNLAELRQLARDLRLGGYALERRDRLTARLLKRIRRRKGLW